MRVVKHSHACVRVETEGAVLVIDPGGFTEAEALDGADAVLLTHEHADHVDLAKLTAARERNGDLRIFTHQAVADQLGPLRDAVTLVDVGDTFDAAGLVVRAYGGMHAEIHRDIPRIANLGYLVADTFYHPGDSFVVPEDVEIPTLFVPVNAPWAKFSESVDFVRAVGPGQAIALHDALLSDVGLTIYNGNMQRLAGVPYARIEPGELIPTP